MRSDANRDAAAVEALLWKAVHVCPHGRMHRPVSGIQLPRAVDCLPDSTSSARSARCSATSTSMQQQTDTSIITTFHCGLLAGEHARNALIAWRVYAQRISSTVESKVALVRRAAQQRCFFAWEQIVQRQAIVGKLAEQYWRSGVYWSVISSWRWFVRLAASERLAVRHARATQLRHVLQVRIKAMCPPCGCRVAAPE